MTVPMKKLDALVADHLERRRLDPKPLEQALSTVLDRGQECSERKRQHIVELNKRAMETDLRRNGFTTRSNVVSPTSTTRS
jgi:site-specific DNA recombinase